MIPVSCRVKHDPDNGAYGDCVRACIASIMELDAEAVPHFYHDNCNGIDGFDRINSFLMTHGLSGFSVAYDGALALADVTNLMRVQNPNTVYMLFGQTDYGEHVVICRGDQRIHDPAWYSTPLTKPTSAGYWIVMVLAKI